jgi:hypothetical protein
MRVRATLATLTVLSLIWAGSLDGQDAGPCPYVYPNPQVGHYAEVEFSNDDGSIPIRFAIVGKERVDGTPHYWIEFLSEPPTLQGTVIVQILVANYPFDQTDIKGYVVKMRDGPAQSVPRDYIPLLLEQSGAPGPSWEEKCAAAEDLGSGNVTVTAGTFVTRHFRVSGDDEGDVWIGEQRRRVIYQREAGRDPVPRLIQPGFVQ